MNQFFSSFLTIVNEMSPYLLLGFLIAGILHVFIPRKFYARFLSRDNKLSVLYAALWGIPLPLCSCGVIPTAIGLKNERASKGFKTLDNIFIRKKRANLLPESRSIYFKCFSVFGKQFKNFINNIHIFPHIYINTVFAFYIA